MTTEFIQQSTDGIRWVNHDYVLILWEYPGDVLCGFIVEIVGHTILNFTVYLKGVNFKLLCSRKILPIINILPST